MKVALVYPPPWKMPGEGDAAARPEAGGPPEGYRPGDLDADFYQIPYGLLVLGAEAKRVGHAVKLLNLSNLPWARVLEVVRDLDADVVGLSCWTANRRGVALVAEAVKAARPATTVVVGGPHATALPEAMMRHHAAIDVLTTGESDVTFVELLDRLGRGQPLVGLAGALVRGARGEVVRGPKRASIKDLDVLASPQRAFTTHILMTSRGCPWACTFCGAESSWGRGFRAHSNDYVLDALEASLGKLPVRMVQIKDDTFTTNKKRVLGLCEAIRARGLRFLWSCDTRVDMLSEELLRAMRLAGCQRLSLGVESGSQRVLDAIDKKITVAEIERSTALAKAHGIKVRHYMMLGNRGETRETFEETLAFLGRAKPHEAIFSCLSVYPGTHDFDEAVRQGWLDPETYFTGTFQELKTPFDASAEDAARMDGWFRNNAGLRVLHQDTPEELEAVLERLGERHPPALMDLGAARAGQGRLDEAEALVREALDGGYPCPGLALNHLACIAKARGDLDGMMDRFSEAAKVDPQHWILMRNVERARAWFRQGGPGQGLPLELEVRHDFLLFERTVQPTLPGPLPDAWATWDASPVAEPSLVPVKTPEQEGSALGLGPGRRLAVLS